MSKLRCWHVWRRASRRVSIANACRQCRLKEVRGPRNIYTWPEAP